jgi:hypothetical protein
MNGSVIGRLIGPHPLPVGDQLGGNPVQGRVQQVGNAVGVA